MIKKEKARFITGRRNGKVFWRGEAGIALLEYIVTLDASRMLCMP
jgi:hypothetical protein